MKSYRVWSILNWESILDVIEIVEVRYVNNFIFELKLICIHVFIYHFTTNF